MLEAIGITNERIVSIIAIVLGFSAITYAHLVFGEQAPKYYSIQRAEKVSLWISRPLNLFRLLFNPVVWVVNASTNFVLRPWGIRLGEEMEAHSEEELRIMISSSTASGVLEPEERDYLNKVFDFGDRVAREIMVPRPDIEAIPSDAPLPELVDAAVYGRYTRYPVYEEDLDHILGAVHVKDLFRAARESPEDFDIGRSSGVPGRTREQAHRGDPQRVPDPYAADGHRHRRVGSVEGLITIEDIVEEIVGEIQDEFDEGEPAIEKISDHLYAVDGRIPITDVNERFELDLPHEDFDTIGGYILGSLGRPPETGDTVEAYGATMQVKSVDGPRVSMLTLQRNENA